MSLPACVSVRGARSSVKYETKGESSSSEDEKAKEDFSNDLDVETSSDEWTSEEEEDDKDNCEEQPATSNSSLPATKEASTNREKNRRIRRRQLGMCYDALGNAVGAKPGTSRNDILKLAMEKFDRLINKNRKLDKELQAYEKVEARKKRYDQMRPAKKILLKYKRFAQKKDAQETDSE